MVPRPAAARRRPALALLAFLALPAPARADAEAWLAGGRAAVARAREERRAEARAPERARNVVLFVADGMGVSTVTAARILEGQLRGDRGEENWLSFERLPYLALVKTYNTNQQVPDSAGTMTAIVTGAKTRAGVVALDETVVRGDYAAADDHQLVTLLERAERRGLATGVVTTTRVTHATPAAGYAHSPERDWESDSRLSPDARAAQFPDIARQLIELRHGDGLDVVLGGGRAQFLPTGVRDPEYPEKTGERRDGRDLTREWTARSGASYVWNASQLAAVDLRTSGPLLGLFEPSHMRFEIDRPNDAAGEPSLSEMTARALDLLSRNEVGFVLIVEGGRIDHGHHLGNAYRALTETIEFARAVQTALERTDPSDTLVVVTSDHGHVLTIGGYPTRGNPILGKVVENDGRGDSGELARDAHGRPYTTLGYYNGPGAARESAMRSEGLRFYWHWLQVKLGIAGRRPDLSEVDTTDPDYVQEAVVPLDFETHSGEDVPAYAGGAGAHLIRGVREQTYLYHVMVEALGWNAN